MTVSEKIKALNIQFQTLHFAKDGGTFTYIMPTLANSLIDVINKIGDHNPDFRLQISEYLIKMEDMKNEIQNRLIDKEEDYWIKENWQRGWKQNYLAACSNLHWDCWRYKENILYQEFEVM